MHRLFEPNDLSVDTIESIAIARDSELGKRAQDLLCSEVIESIQLIRNFNEYRQTYRIQAGSKYILKVADADTLATETALAYRLIHTGLPTPRPVVLRSGGLSETFGEKGYAFFEYIPGLHFRGGLAKLESAASEIFQLHQVLRTFDVGVNRRVSVSSQLEELSGSLDELHNTVEALLPGGTATIFKAIEQVRDQVSLLEVMQLSHTDLHPQNLLFNDDRLVGILDIEDIRAFPFVSAVGFAALKLTREHWCRNNQNPNADEIATSMKTWKSLFAYEGWQLRIGAYYRVLENIRSMCNCFRKHKSQECFRGLLKQVGSLFEADMLFGKTP